MTQNISHKIVKNTFFNAIGRFWGILIAIVLTPYTISHIGVERYGVWAIVGVFTSYFGLLDFGVRTAFVKYIAEFHSKKDYEKVNQVVGTGFFSYAIFTVVSVFASFFIARPLFAFFDFPTHLYEEGRFVLIMGIALFGVSSAMSAVGAVQAGLQRMEISNILTIAVSVPNIAGTVFFLEKGCGLRGLMWNNAIVLGLSSAASLVIALKLLPGFKLSPAMFTRGIFKKLFNYGYKLQISSLANVVCFQSDRILITYFLGVGLVAFYQLGIGVLQAVRQVCLLLISSVTPAASEMEATSSKESLRKLYIRGSKYLVFLSLPLTVFAAANAAVILAAWMGTGYEKSVLVVQILAVGYFAATVTGVASAIAAGVAKTDLDMKFGIFLTVLELFLGIFMIIKMGFLGIVTASAVSLVVASIYYVKLFHGYLGTSARDFAVLFYKPLAAVIFPGAAMLAVNHYFWLDKASCGRLFNLSVLTAQGLFFAGFYGACIAGCGYFDEYDKSLFKARLPWLARLFKIR